MIIRTRVVHGIGWQGPESMGDMTRVHLFRDDPWTSHTVFAAPVKLQTMLASLTLVAFVTGTGGRQGDVQISTALDSHRSRTFPSPP